MDGLGENLIEYWQEYCIPKAVQNIYDSNFEPVGLDTEIHRVVQHLLKVDGSPLFLTIKGPAGCGKSEIVSAALKRIYNQNNPYYYTQNQSKSQPAGAVTSSFDDFSEIDLTEECPICYRPCHLCNVRYMVMELDSPFSSVDAFQSLFGYVSEHRLLETDGRPAFNMKKVREQLSYFFKTTKVKKIIWIKNDLKPKELESFLYYITNLIHDKEAIMNISIVIETRTRLVTDLDARIASRLSNKILTIRPFDKSVVCKFVASRLTFNDGSFQKQPVVGNGGPCTKVHGSVFSRDRQRQQQQQQHEEEKEKESPLFVDVAYNSEQILTASFVSKDNETLEQILRQPAPGKSKGFRHIELWAPPGHKIHSVWMTKDQETDTAVRGLGLITYAGNPPAVENKQAVRVWNELVRTLATCNLVLERLEVLGCFEKVKSILSTWLIRLSKPLEGMQNVLAELKTSIHSKMTDRDMVKTLSNQLAFHFSVSSKFNESSLPEGISKRALTTTLPSKRTKLNSEIEGTLQCSHYYGIKEFSNLTNTQLVLLCLLLDLQTTLFTERQKQGGLVDEEKQSSNIEVTANAVFESYVKRARSIVGKAKIEEHEWACYMELDVLHLLDQKLIRQSAHRKHRTLSDTKILVEVDKISVIQYLRSQRQAGSQATCSDTVFTILNLDQDLSLISGE